MKAFFVAALVAGMALAYGTDPHAASPLDYNGVSAVVAQIVASLKS
jgi:hypothetical protein